MLGEVSLADYGLLCVNKWLECRRDVRRLASPPDHLSGFLVLLALAPPGPM
jgi:hypothetical protein